MKPVIDYINPWVRQVESYNDKHLEFAWEHPEIIRMMSNENPLPPSEDILNVITETARQGNLYPNTGPLLRQKLAERVGLSPDNVILGNGSTDVINYIINTFVAPGDEVIISVPTFSMYETRTRVNGGIPVLIPMTPDFCWNIDAMVDAITSKTKLIFVCSPNNPTGNRLPEIELRRLLSTGIPIFLDEAYYELEDDPQTCAQMISESANLIVNRTFSKAFGLAGLRIGYAFADQEVVSYLNRMKIPWNVSLLALAAALKAIENHEDQGAKRKNCLDGRNYLFREINKIPGLQAFRSEGNFVLINASSLEKTSIEIMDALISRNIFIRPMTGHQMKEGFIRVTVGNPEQNRQFIKTLIEYTLEIKKEA